MLNVKAERRVGHRRIEVSNTCSEQILRTTSSVALGSENQGFPTIQGCARITIMLKFLFIICLSTVGIAILSLEDFYGIVSNKALTVSVYILFAVLLIGIIGFLVTSIRKLIKRKPTKHKVQSEVHLEGGISRMSESHQETTQQIKKEETKKWQPYWKIVGFGAILFWIIGIGFIWAGMQTIYDVDSILYGGNATAYNYIIAANRGIGLIGVGIAALIIGGTDAIVNVIRRTSTK